MSAVIAEAVNVALPVLAGGVTATATGAAEAGGARIYDAVSRLVAKVRHRIGDGEVTEPVLLRAFEDGLAAGEITEHELRTLIAIGGGGRTSIGRIEAKSVYIDTEINARYFQG